MIRKWCHEHPTTDDTGAILRTLRPVPLPPDAHRMLKGTEAFRLLSHQGGDLMKYDAINVMIVLDIAALVILLV